jgi:nucleoside-diphosphate-sugar epimerase
MIIGNGLLATGFIGLDGYNDYLVFASGVSDSNETSSKEFDREKELLLTCLNENKDLKIIYFSSILVGVSDNKYYNHKLEMENIIKSTSNNYIIFRVPQVIGLDGNKNNLIKTITNSIKKDLEITIYKDVDRSLVDVEDIVKVVNYCKDKIVRQTLYFSDIEKMSVTNLCHHIGFHLNKEPILKVKNDPEIKNWYVNNSEIIDRAISLLIDKNGYTDKIIKKYIKK